jgi:tRNA nucleotidyltransferase (CCA-adding enzyme)
MKFTPNMANLQNGIDAILQEHPTIKNIVQSIDAQKGRALLVGGAVRDLLLGRASKDIDIEVHGVPLAMLEEVLKKQGPVSAVGKSFGVLRIHNLDVDWSLPRTDSVGRKPIVSIDPNMSFKQAFERRDLTINAMGVDFITKELIDPFDGLKDLEQGILRAPNPETFVEDPLRFFRVMQMIARFEMSPDDELENVCRTMSIEHVSRERIELEFEKMLLQSERPSKGIRWLREVGRLAAVLPELDATINVEQDPRWHPEGDVFEHSMQALDAAAIIARTYEDRHQKLILLYTALVHDLGKAVTTERMPNGSITSYNHEVAGVDLARAMLKRITENHDLLNAILKLVRHHMTPVIFVKEGAKASAYKRLANKLDPEASIARLADLAYADIRGRNAHSMEPLNIEIPELVTFIERADQAKVHYKPEEPALKGRDLLDEIKPGKEMGRLLDRAYEIQIEEGITDKDELKKRVLGKHKT